MSDLARDFLAVRSALAAKIYTMMEEKGDKNLISLSTNSTLHWISYLAYVHTIVTFDKEHLIFQSLF